MKRYLPLLLIAGVLMGVAVYYGFHHTIPFAQTLPEPPTPPDPGPLPPLPN